MNDLSRYSDDDIITILSADAEEELIKRGYEYGWHKRNPYVGAIYILVNPAFPDLVKIGYADNVSKRVKSLNRNSGLPDPYHCYAVHYVKKRLEDLKLHALIDTLDPSLRHSKNREFYEMSKEKAYSILFAIAEINGNESQLVKDPFNDDFFITDQIVVEDGDSKKRHQSERLTFKNIGVPVGSTLTFLNDSSVTCITIDDTNQVRYGEDEYSISALAKKLLNVTAAQGGKYFCYNGELLTDIRARLGV